MTKPQTLNVLIDLTHDAVDEAARRMQQAQQEKDKAQKQLELLHSYRLDYAQRLQTSSQQGVPAAKYLNFQRFLTTLDEAISQQNQIVAQSELRLEAGRKQWAAEKRRLGAYETLDTRRREQQARQMARREQKANDEMASSLLRRKRG